MSGLKVLGAKVCQYCGKEFSRQMIGNRLEDVGVFSRRKYCSLSCSNSKKHPTHWETYHYRARKHRKAYCEACLTDRQLHAHHVDGNPENNSAGNIQTLCVHCHNFLHATAERLGRAVPGRMPSLAPLSE